MAESDPRPFKTASPDEPRAPDGVTIYAIGDLHGRADLLERLMEQIRADRAATADRAELIFIGDYIDRGPSSDAVIDQILDLQHDPDFSVTTLKGNHESLALQFLADPAVGHFWCHIGGRQTLLSYGVTPPIGPSDMEQWEATRRAFEAALPATHLAFLQQLSIYAVRGSYVFVHAGLRPGVKLARQREWDMLWIRNEFLEHRGRFEKIVVHGHTSEDQPFLGPNRIGIDTGAETSSRLTGLKLVGTEQRLMSATMPAQSSRAVDGSFYPATRPPARPSPPLPRAPGGPAAAVAPAPWRRALSAEAWAYATLPAGLAAVAAIGYLASQTATPAQAPPPEERLAAPGANPDIDDLTARADEALEAAASRARTRGAEAAKSTTIVPQLGRTGPAVAAVRPPSAKASSIPMTVPATTPAASTSSAAAPAAPIAAKADRTAVATSAAKDMPASKSGGRQAEPRRTAPSTGPQAPPAGNRVAAAASGPKPLPSPQDRRRKTEIAATPPDVVPAASGEAAQGPDPDPGASAGPLAAYTRSVPMMNSNRIGPLDYPNASIRADEEGVVGVRYVVTADGRVSTCTTIEPSSFARLNRRTCELIRTRFRFKPALRNGQPVEEEREQRIRWELSG